MNSRVRVGYLVSHPIQYQVPFFRTANQHGKLDLVALFGCNFGLTPSFDPQFGKTVDFGIDLVGGYPSVFIDQWPRAPRVDRFLGLVARSIDKVIQEQRLDCLVLHGWRTAMMWQAAFAAKKLGLPYFIRAETPDLRGVQEVRTARRRVRNAAVGALVRSAAGGLSLGTANERFLTQMGVSQERIHRMPYFVDNDLVEREAEAGRRDRAALRKSWNVPEDAFVVTSVAKLTPRKRALDVVRALPRLPQDIHVVWVGTGEQARVIKETARELGVEDRFHLVGFLPSAEAFRVLGASDLFVLPSENEPWGLVVNEAVVAGLPVLVSSQCGSAEDLVRAGQTGEVLPVGDIDAWARAITAWRHRVKLGDGGNRDEMRRLAEAHSIGTAVDALERAVLRAIGQERR